MQVHRTIPIYPSSPAQAMARLLAHRTVEPASGCWLWTGHRTRRGYGRVTWHQRQYFVHRLAIGASKGLEPAVGQIIRHTCDHRACFNPDHLCMGSPYDNMRDALRRGCKAHGVRSPHSKLTAEEVAHEEVAQIRSALLVGRTERSIAEQFGVNQATVNAIRNGRTHRTVATPLYVVELRMHGAIHYLNIPEPIVRDLIDRYGDSSEDPRLADAAGGPAAQNNTSL